MASIFTYDPNPPRVASPWLKAAEASTPDEGDGDDVRGLRAAALSLREGVQHGRVTRLQAEPQEGPVEYKLHLLLRPRRKFRSTSTGTQISGSKHSMLDGFQSNESFLGEGIDQATLTASSGLTQQTRQHRLEQLTTQLLWRLQQSSPHHTSSATNTILPSLPEALPELLAPQQPAKLLHGLEESQGALYEIGVTDDGSLVGLAEDEMSESLNNLRAMAACLGCTVEILREETVGECEWLEDTVVTKKERRIRKSGKLVVAEALVKPFLQVTGQSGAGDNNEALAEQGTAQFAAPATEQLRVTLTGPTGCGKSTLLGSLVTSTLDNGRGKSRLSMLKHRHEITSGITSSVTQELLGYRDAGGGDLDVVNYATENVASWIDIHVAAAGDRMVFISDSAGHPRYRRTTLRGLVGWAPHWTLLCIPADDTETAGSRTGPTDSPLGTSVHDMDLSGAQLDLCLRLGLPLVIVITKLDVASLSGLRQTLTKALDALKAVGKKPVMLKNEPGAVGDEKELQHVGRDIIGTAYKAAVPLLNDPRQTVPIVLTSAFNGIGIANLHGLLHELPIPDETHAESSPSSQLVFDIEDVYNKPAEVAGVIISGHLRTGQISVGDEAVIGPFSSLDSHEDSEDSDERPFRRNQAHLSTSRSFPGALRGSHLTPPFYLLPNQEWRRVKIISARNLRLPVHSLHADQVGTLAIAADDSDGKSLLLGRIRKGMILTAIQPLATRTFTAKFRREDLESLAVGNHVVVYISSVRASAKVVSARVPDSPDADRQTSNGEEAFSFEEEENGDGQGTSAGTASDLLVTMSFVASKEFVLTGDQVLVMPGGGPGLFGGNTERGEKGLAGLEGFVGEIVEVRG